MCQLPAIYITFDWLLQEQAALLHAIIKLRPHDGIHHIQPQLQTLQAAKPLLAALKPLWLTIIAAATAAGPQAAASAEGFVKEWMMDADLFSAETAADIINVQVLHLQQAKHTVQVGHCPMLTSSISPGSIC